MYEPRKSNSRVGRQVAEETQPGQTATASTQGRASTELEAGGEREIGLGRVLISVGISLVVLVGVGVGMNYWMSSVQSDADTFNGSAHAAVSAVGSSPETSILDLGMGDPSGPNSIDTATNEKLAAAVVIPPMDLPATRIAPAAGNALGTAEAGTASAGTTDAGPTDAGADEVGTDDVDVAEVVRLGGDGGDSGVSEMTSTVGESATVVVDYAAAETLYQKGDYAEAAVHFAAWASAHTETPWGYYMEALSLWKSGDALAAEEVFLRALDCQPDHLKSLVNLTRVRLDLGKYDDARLPIERALGLAPQSAQVHRVFGRVESNLGATEAAEARYLQALRIEPEDAWSLNNLGLLRIESGRFEEALAPLALAREIDPENAIVQNNLGVALERSGDLRSAELAYGSAIASDPSHARAVVSRERVAALLFHQSRPTVDLVGLAQRFGEELAASDTFAGNPEVEGSTGLDVIAVVDRSVEVGLPSPGKGSMEVDVPLVAFQEGAESR